jgi:uncharacterized membrane protein (UPF0127 family)
VASFLSALVRNPHGDFHLVNEQNGSVVADRLLPAFDSETRRTGLLRHESLPAGTAMIIAPTNAIHTFFMKFAIDVLFIAKDGLVVKTRTRLAPWRISAAWHAHAVIELSAGSLARSPVNKGDRVALVDARLP